MGNVINSCPNNTILLSTVNLQNPSSSCEAKGVTTIYDDSRSGSFGNINDIVKKDNFLYCSTYQGNIIKVDLNNNSYSQLKLKDYDSTSRIFGGLTMDSNNNLFVTCYKTYNILKIDTNNNVSLLAGKSTYENPPSDNTIGTSATFAYLGGIEINSLGDLFVIDFLYVRKIQNNQYRTVNTIISSISGYPNGLVFDKNDNLYVSTSGNSPSILKIDSINVKSNTFVRSKTTPNIPFTNIINFQAGVSDNGVTIDKINNILYISSEDRCIRKIDLGNIPITATILSGTIGRNISVDSATVSGGLFTYTQSICFDLNKLYVIDIFYKIRKINLS